MEEDKLIESKKILTDYMLELNSDIQRAEDWVNTGADEEMYFALQIVLNELEKLQKENEDWSKAYQEEKDEQFDLLTNSIPKQVIRDKFKRINETKIKSDKINATNYMIFGNTERATGWFINLDYIEKILLDVPGYKIGDE